MRRDRAVPRRRGRRRGRRRAGSRAWFLARHGRPGRPHAPAGRRRRRLRRASSSSGRSATSASCSPTGSLAQVVAARDARRLRALRRPLRDASRRRGRSAPGCSSGCSGLAIVWLTQLPFAVAALWWERRHDVSEVGYLEAVFGGWLGLGGTFVAICIALLVVMALARRLGSGGGSPARRCSPRSPLLLVFVGPYLTPGLEKPDDPELADDVRALRARRRASSDDPAPRRGGERRHEPGERLRVRHRAVARRSCSGTRCSTAASPTARCDVVLAHELGHHSSDHIPEAVAWFGLFALARRAGPRCCDARAAAAWASRRPSRSRSSSPRSSSSRWRRPRTSSAGGPRPRRTGRRSRRRATRAAARGLFREFAETSLGDPSPPTWAYVLLQTPPDARAARRDGGRVGGAAGRAPLRAQPPQPDPVGDDLRDRERRGRARRRRVADVERRRPPRGRRSRRAASRPGRAPAPGSRHGPGRTSATSSSGRSRCAAATKRRVERSRTISSSARPPVPAREPPEAGRAERLAEVAERHVPAPVALAGEREHGVRAEPDLAVGTRRRVDAEERERRVGTGYTRPRTRCRRSGRSDEVVAAERHDPRLGRRPAQRGEAIGVDAGADDHPGGLDGAARRLDDGRAAAAREARPRLVPSRSSPPAAATSSAIRVGDAREVDDGGVGRVERLDPGDVRLELAEPLRPDQLDARHAVRERARRWSSASRGSSASSVATTTFPQRSDRDPALVAVGEQPLGAARRRAGPSASPARSRRRGGRRRSSGRSGGVPTAGSLSRTREPVARAARLELTRDREAEDPAADDDRVVARHRRPGRRAHLRQRVLGAGAALGRREPAALGADRAALDAVRRRHASPRPCRRRRRRRPRRRAPGTSTATSPRASRGTCVWMRTWLGWSSRVRLPDAKTDESLSKVSVPSGAG